MLMIFIGIERSRGRHHINGMVTLLAPQASVRAAPSKPAFSRRQRLLPPGCPGTQQGDHSQSQGSWITLLKLLIGREQSRDFRCVILMYWFHTQYIIDSP